jgi:hypothetical protein
MGTVLVPHTSKSPQTTLAAEAHLAEGQFLLEEQILNISAIPTRHSKTISLQNRRAEFRPKVNLNREHNNNNNLF